MYRDRSTTPPRKEYCTLSSTIIVQIVLTVCYRSREGLWVFNYTWNILKVKADSDHCLPIAGNEGWSMSFILAVSREYKSQSRYPSTRVLTNWFVDHNLNSFSAVKWFSPEKFQSSNCLKLYKYFRSRVDLTKNLWIPKASISRNALSSRHNRRQATHKNSKL